MAEKDSSNVGGKIVAAGGALLVIGSFLPWAKVVAPFIGEITISGTDGGDGVFTIIGGGILVALGWSATQGSRPKTSSLIIGALMVLLAIYEFGDLSNRAEEVEEFGDLNYGVGLYLVLAGAAAAIVGAIKLGPKVDAAERDPDSQVPLPGTPATEADSLEQIVAMHEQGLLDDEEFAAAKRRVLGLP